jgi:hypothetical protein
LAALLDPTIIDRLLVESNRLWSLTLIELGRL